MIKIAVQLVVINIPIKLLPATLPIRPNMKIKQTAMALKKIRIQNEWLLNMTILCANLYFRFVGNKSWHKPPSKLAKFPQPSSTDKNRKDE